MGRSLKVTIMRVRCPEHVSGQEKDHGMDDFIQLARIVTFLCFPLTATVTVAVWPFVVSVTVQQDRREAVKYRDPEPGPVWPR